MKSTKSIKFTLVALLFILSGVAGLIYQVVWFKHLSYFLGNTTYSQAIVLATFMGGLAIGAWWWGKKADDSKNALKLFAWLEIGIAVYCFFYMPIFNGVKVGFISLVKSQGWASDSGIVLALKFIVSILTMLIPTILMGGTLPVLVKYLSNRIQDVGKNVSILYFINSLGAVIGTVLAGFYLLQTIGLKATVYVGATMDLLVGLFFLGFIYISKKQSVTTPQANKKSIKKEVKPVFTVTPKQYKLVVIIAAISGLCAMIYEVVWLRLLIPILSSTTYSFTIILTAFITGITLGSLLVYFLLPRLKNGFTFLGYCQLGVVISILLTLPFYEKIPYLIWSAIGDDMKTEAGYTKYLTTQFYYAFIIMIVPTIFMGMSLPIASRIAVRKVKESGQKIGNIFAINTVGTVIGSLLAGLVLIPFIGIKSTIEVALVLNLTLAIFVFFSPKVIKKRTKIILALITILSAGYYYQKVDQERWAYSIMMSEVARKVNRTKQPATFDKFIKQQKKYHNNILYYKEGVGGTIIVAQKEKETYLFTNGKGDANSMRDLRTQVMLGHTPMLLHSNPDTVLVIGFGAGTTIGSVLKHDNVKYAEVAEISPEVIEASVHFEHVNQKPLDDQRLRVIKDDGLSALRLSPYKYDVIISQPSNPWSAGVGNLFTREFFRDCKEKLRPDGFVAQWFSLYEVNDESLKLILRTALSEFDNVSLWQLGINDILIICTEDSFNFKIPKIEKKYKSIEKSLKNINMFSFPVFLSQQITSSDSLIRKHINKGSINAENMPFLEYWTPKNYFLRESPKIQDKLDERGNLFKSKLLLNQYVNEYKKLSQDDILQIGLFNSLGGNKKLAFMFADLNTDIYEAWAIKAIEKKNYKKALEYLDRGIKVSVNNVSLVNKKAQVLAEYRGVKESVIFMDKILKISPDIKEFHEIKVEYLLKLNRKNEAVYHLEKILEIDPTSVDAYIQLSKIKGKGGDYHAALDLLNKAVKISDTIPELYYNRAYIKGFLKLDREAIEDFSLAISLKPDYARAYFLRGRLFLSIGNTINACKDFKEANRLGIKQAYNLLKENCN